MIRLGRVRTAVLVLAHPDDETLWCGGLVIRTVPRIAWAAICCTVPARDPIRARKFLAACEALGIRETRVIERTETPAREPLPPEHLAEIGDLAGFDLVVTHGPRGEYGHVHHIQIGEHVRKIRPDAAAIVYDGPGTYAVNLTDAERAAKLAALKCYDHVLPYNGREMPKWEALVERYNRDRSIWTESYDGICD